MRTSRTIVFCILVGLLLVGGLLLFRFQPEAPVETSNRGSSETSKGSNEIGVSPQAPAYRQAQPQTVRSRTASIEEQVAEHRVVANVPIEFWGKVIDHESRPLTEVHIKGRVRQWKASVSLQGYTGFSTVDTKTDDDGLFHISGQSGDVLSLVIEKEGYEVEPHAKKSFGFNTSEQYKSDPGAPVLFRLWKADINEKLITGKKSFRIEPNGKPYAIDLRAGGLVESPLGDLQVSVTYTNEVVLGRLDDWIAELVPLNCGILQETNRSSSMYLAPENGYTSSRVRYQQKIKGGQSGSTGEERFFLMLNDGREFGRISIEMLAPYNPDIPGLVRVEYAINPSGSRILR